jgi:hypothetical protein
MFLQIFVVFALHFECQIDANSASSVLDNKRVLKIFYAWHQSLFGNVSKFLSLESTPESEKFNLFDVEEFLKDQPKSNRKVL